MTSCTHVLPVVARGLLAATCLLVVWPASTLSAASPAGAATAAPTCQASKPAAASDAVPLDRKVAERMRDGGMVGVGAAIIIDGKVAWTQGYGWADRERRIAFTPDTVMNIGSITKTVTGVAMMQAVHDGLLALDADINRYLPFKVVNPAFPDTPITLRQLATHTSSISDRMAVYDTVYHYGGDSPVALGDFLAGYFVPGGNDYDAGNFLAQAPGTHREYSNIGAALVGYIVERVSGEAFTDYTRRRIFEPLGMDRTGWRLSDIPRDRHAALYVSQLGLTIPIPLYGMTSYPDGGVRSSVADLSRFFIALLQGGGRMLDPASTREMLRLQFDAGHHPDNVDPADKNSGLFWATKLGGSLVGHGGTDPGLKTEMLFDPAQGVGVILFTNTSLCDDAMGAYVGLLHDLRAHALTLKHAAR
jgi:CubicO group peptidase (beta-lactamase class C family)